MAKKAAAAGQGNALVIVESPAKAKTIGKYLGKGYTVEASVGHVRDLPQGAAQIPAKYKGEKWASLGVNVEKDFEPIYVVSPGKTKQIKLLKDQLKKADTLYLATDEDREGEAISWHLLELLQPKVPVHRLVFHEITQDAIQEAIRSPRSVDTGLVKAQETRRILDRLYGYEVSPLLWRKVRPKLSAGRVQSVAVRLIVERERERMLFVSSTWWDLQAVFTKKNDAKQRLETTIVSVDGKRLPSGKDFDDRTGELKNTAMLLLDGPAAEKLAEKLRTGEFRVASVEEKPYTTKPYAPFTTSTLQQEANRKLGFTARRTMQVAQALYENGHITYMRTDSTNLSKLAVEEARNLVRSEYGEKYLPGAPRVYSSKVKNAQEAHEAIRPAGTPFAVPSVLKAQLGADEFKIFDLVWKRTIASQMEDSRGRRIVVTIEGEGCVFTVSGKTIDFPGYLRAYVEGSDDPDAELADQEKALPSVEVGEALDVASMIAKDHTTQPPSRFSEAALTKALEEKGIGRPSTYASIIDTILARNYVFKKGGALVPTWVAFSVVKLLEDHLTGLVDYQFTAQMEDDLDAISRGERDNLDYLKNFYFGNGKPGLKRQLENKVEEIDARSISRISLGKADDGEEVFVRVGRYSPFVEKGEQTASLPDELPPDEVKLSYALDLLSQAEKAEEPLGYDPETGKPVYLKIGRFGPYVMRGTPEDEEKPKNASLMKGMAPEDVDFETALKLLSLPRELGVHPTLEGKIEAFNGRYGPYVKCGSETRSLPSDISPLDVSLEQAIELLNQPKQRGRGAAKPPLRVFEEKSPVTEGVVQIMDGRYGPYVTDGESNASLPKAQSPEELTFAAALELLAARAAAGGSKKKKPAKKKTTKKAATKKSTAKKKTTKGTTKRAPKKAD
ncbi:type I DNA topoisomerase [Botrimarina mediterranea]|uniref:DNA topoisomerase 1 n=1 Tax=Botrimarina mediterranea TaxID=2528022 RepID=A0A518K6C3_9BACT|nr:type I DNA topoisomerase [Botrimarina mediterranea]QDV73330.1 DNA topoisomerase 1 [Botrimarina mediterranea]QDV77847.1 DNA topoisomerase 1 [Planctomycetes bacterium K2D]